MGERTKGLISFIELIETIADNKYVLGDRLVEVGVSGPNLEATLAAIAMAQGELGHARLLYNWVFDLDGYTGKKPEIIEQTGKAFHGVVNVHNWISLIAALYSVNTAVNIVLKSSLDANHSKVASRVHKLIREQKEHIIYSQNWARQLLEDKGSIPRRFKESLNQVNHETEAWLKSLEQQKELFEEGYLLEGFSLSREFKEELKQLNIQNFVSVE